MKGTLHFGTHYTKKHAAEGGSKQSNFPLGVESDTGVHSFFFLRSVTGRENSNRPLNQSNAKV